ncbi:DUF2628 domain-containing protein [Rhizobium sp. L1K21]|uniref:DUF2628 domain-containing protein n=1 Tax=Rhizobium sp. L1K21 TaxID=2954933 RepID=UPI002093758A|nr:DUF2628 domain-containing protein [Rhizobium sp. L1K21]MCO6187949.1 DUF2628 domain-containing protein [Rhizobium sp. L1K21]
MTSYIVLSPPGGIARDEKNRFIKDGFSIWAAVFPFIWALTKKLYVEALILFAIELAIIYLSQNPDLEGPATAVSLIISLLWGLEARNWLVGRLEKKGWQQEAVISAPTLGDAEAMFYGNAAPAREPPWGRTTTNKAATPGGTAMALGLMDYEKGRR